MTHMMSGVAEVKDNISKTLKKWRHMNRLWEIHVIKPFEDILTKDIRIGNSRNIKNKKKTSSIKWNLDKESKTWINYQLS